MGCTTTSMANATEPTPPATTAPPSQAPTTVPTAVPTAATTSLRRPPFRKLSTSFEVEQDMAVCGALCHFAYGNFIMLGSTDIQELQCKECSQKYGCALCAHDIGGTVPGCDECTTTSMANATEPTPPATTAPPSQAPTTVPTAVPTAATTYLRPFRKGV